MKTLAILALTMPFGGAPTPPGWTRMEIMGLPIFLGPSKSKIGVDGLLLTMPVHAAGGTGEAKVRQGLTRDIAMVIREVDAKELADLFDLPLWLKPKLVGRVGLVTLDMKSDDFDLQASHFRIPGDPIARIRVTGSTKTKKVKVRAEAFGGLVEYDGYFGEPGAR